MQPGLLGHTTPDSIAVIWLKDHDRTAEVAAALRAYAASLGIETLYSGNQIKYIFDGTLKFERHRRPDIIIQPVPGVIYTTTSVATKKVEHGGFSEDNTHVPLVVVGPGVHHGTVTEAVDLRQVAPTILKALGLKPRDLEAVRKEHTHRLPPVADEGDDEDDDDDGDNGD